MLSLRAGISASYGERPRMPELEPAPELSLLLRFTTDGDQRSGDGDQHSGERDHPSGDRDQHSGNSAQSGHLRAGIGGHLRSESVVTFDWNRWSRCPGIRKQISVETDPS